MTKDVQVINDFYALVSDTYGGYQFVQDNPYQPIDTYSTAKAAFSAVRDMESPYDIAVARVQIIIK